MRRGPVHAIAVPAPLGDTGEAASAAEVRMRARAIVGLLLVGSAGVAAAGELVLPVFALRWPGKDGNRWSSEVYLTNPGGKAVRVGTGRFLPGIVQVVYACLPPVPAWREVPPHTTVVWSLEQFSLDLGCPEFALGGLAFEADGEVRIIARVVNERGAEGSGPILAGYGQEVPAPGYAERAGPGAVWQLPGLVWHPNACGPPRFESYLYLANPGDVAAEVTLMQFPDGREGTLVVSGQTVQTPFTFTVPAQGWRQLRVELGGILPAVCMQPQVVDLFFTTSAGVAACAAVVDRSSQDPWTVLPVRTAP